MRNARSAFRSRVRRRIAADPERAARYRARRKETAKPVVICYRKPADRRGLQWLRRRRRPVALVIVGGVLLGLPYGPQVWSDYRLAVTMNIGPLVLWLKAGPARRAS
jgi:hypothetical protein